MRNALAQLLDLRLATDLRQLLQLLLGPLELHGQQRTLDLEMRSTLESLGESDDREARDDPLGGIELPPAHAIAVVVRKDVVEVVIALAVGDERQYRIVASCVLVRVRTCSPHMGQRVDEERDVMANDEAEDARQNERAPDVANRPAGEDRKTDVRA